MRDSFIVVPPDVSDPTVLKRFLDTLIEKLDVAYSNRGDGGFARLADTVKATDSVRELSVEINKLIPNYLKRDSSNLEELHYTTIPTMTDKTLVHKGYVDSKYSPATAPDKLSDDATLTETINKVNELIDKLIQSKILV